MTRNSHVNKNFKTTDTIDTIETKTHFTNRKQKAMPLTK